MQLKYLYWIDKNVGILLCWLIIIREFFLKLFRFFSKKKPPENNIRKMLIIKFWGAGSIILAVGAFQALRYNFPDVHLCVFTLKQNKPVYEMLGIFDEIIDADLTTVPYFLSSILKSLARIRKKRFDVAIDFEFTSRFTAIVTYLSNSPKRIGFRYQGVWRGNCYTDEVEFKEDRKIKLSFLDLAKKNAVDFLIPTSLPSLHLKPEDKEYIDTLLIQDRIPSNTALVGMNINASELSLLRRWPKEYFIELIEGLIKKYSVHVIFIGDQKDSEYVSETMEQIPFKEYTHNFSGRTSWPQLVYLLGKMRLFICNDSGPLHLANYIGIPTVSFFGPETPLIYGPEGQSDIVFYKKLDCSPCIRVKNYKRSKCIDNHRCLREIKPSEVINEIERKRIL